jgi:aldose 1-epimerase
MKSVITFVSLILLVGSLSGDPSVKSKHYGDMPDGKKVTEYTLKNENGLVVKVIDYGAIVTELWIPDRDGKMADVVLGYDNLDGYLEVTPYFGAIVGRYGNRIALGEFSIDGETYSLATNNDLNHLHGGNVGFDKVVWKSKGYSDDEESGVKLTYHSPDGEEGYPGNLKSTVVYALNNQNELVIRYHAETDKPTVVNLTHHGYWNLRGQGNGSILGHELTLNAKFFTPVDEGLIPTGEIRSVEGTPMDFSRPKRIGSRIDADCEQLTFGGGYDHNWVLDKSGGGMTFAARLYDPDSGRQMEVYTEEPGIQFYCGNFLDGTLTGKEGKVYHYRYGLCLETQHFPDSPNKGHFPSTRLNPGEVYETTTVHKFSVQ